MKLFSIICLFSVTGIGFSQTLTEKSYVPPVLLDNGSPSTNIIDPNGAKQGMWYYSDYKGETCFSQRFEDHELIESFVKTGDHWKSTNSFPSLNESKEVMKSELSAYFTTYKSTTGEDKQFFIYPVNNRPSIVYLGDWNAGEIPKFEKKAIAIVLKYTTDYDVFLFFE